MRITSSKMQVTCIDILDILDIIYMDPLGCLVGWLVLPFFFFDLLQPLFLVSFRKSDRSSDEPRKKPHYFPLNPGW